MGPTSLEDKALLEREAGFTYMAAVDELLNAYVFCRPNIGYAMADLSKISQNPAWCHYSLVKRVFRYLRQNKDCTLIFWRKKPNMLFPSIHLEKRVLEESDLRFTKPLEDMQLDIYVDAAHFFWCAHRVHGISAT